MTTKITDDEAAAIRKATSEAIRREFSRGLTERGGCSDCGWKRMKVTSVILSHDVKGNELVVLTLNCDHCGKGEFKMRIAYWSQTDDWTKFYPTVGTVYTAGE